MEEARPDPAVTAPPTLDTAAAAAAAAATDIWEAHRRTLPQAARPRVDLAATTARSAAPDVPASSASLSHPSRGQFASTFSLLSRQRFQRSFDVTSLHLSPAQLSLFHANPHLQQVFVNRRPWVTMDRPLRAHDRTLRADSGARKYERRQGEVKTVEHWGQRKLLLSEIEFLTTHAKPGQLVIYAGAAPGNHVPFLAEQLFPHLRFLLVDPAPFACKQTQQIQIRNVSKHKQRNSTDATQRSESADRELTAVVHCLSAVCRRRSISPPICVVLSVPRIPLTVPASC